MKAIVKVINQNRRMYGAEIEGAGEYVIFELLDSSESEKVTQSHILIFILWVVKHIRI